MDRKLHVMIWCKPEDDALHLIDVLWNDTLLPIWQQVTSFATLQQALESQRWDLLLTWGRQSVDDTLAVLALLEHHAPDLPCIVVTDAVTDEQLRRLMHAGARDCILTSQLQRLLPAVEREVGVTSLRTTKRAVVAALARRDDELRTMSSEYMLRFEEFQDSKAQPNEIYDTLIASWSQALDLRERLAAGHSSLLADHTLQLARVLDIPPAYQDHLRRGALLHDIGMSIVPDDILFKQDPLTQEEWTVIRHHPITACELLAPIGMLGPAMDIPHYHHERWDGTGYPDGLSGEAIPQAARIFAVVDVWHALRSARSYRAAWPPQDATAYIVAGSGTQFDPSVVHAFEQHLSQHAMRRTRSPADMVSETA